MQIIFAIKIIFSYVTKLIGLICTETSVAVRNSVLRLWPKRRFSWGVLCKINGGTTPLKKTKEISLETRKIET